MLASALVLILCIGYEFDSVMDILFSTNKINLDKQKHYCILAINM